MIHNNNFHPNEKLDFPPGGYPEYFTDVKAPGPASGGFSSIFASSLAPHATPPPPPGAPIFPVGSSVPQGADPPALPTVPTLPDGANLSSGASSCPRLKLLYPPG